MNRIVRSAAVVAGLWGALASAEPDSFGLGQGTQGSLTVSGTQVVNAYAVLTAPRAPGDISLPVSTIAGFAAGDLVLVLQTTGAVPTPASGATAAIDLSPDAVGSWELGRVSSAAGTALTLTAPLVRGYAAQVTQVVRVPEYVNVTVPASATLTAKAWDGSSGGVLAFLATGTVSVQGTVSVAGLGFRGGVKTNDATGPSNCSGLDEAAPRGAQKGEGLANTRYGAAHTGRGNVGNGGGGGVCHNSGGGGGGHGGRGGQGGDSFDGGRTVGGIGGAALQYSLLSRLALGGGGGAGHGNNDLAGGGGAGGGAIFARVGAVSGNGTWSADGRSGAGSTGAGNDGAGGGGAGGSISLRASGAVACTSLSARGGNGGDLAGTTDAHGPGGGGGGGRVLVQSTALSGCLTGTSVNSGVAGKDQGGTGSVFGAGPSSPSSAGNVGSVENPSGGFAVPAVPVVTAPAEGSFTSNLRPAVSGTAPAGALVVVYLDGAEVGRTTAAAGGGWTFTPTSNLANGPHRAQAAVESQGVQSAKALGTAFTVDTAAPAAPALTAPAAGTLTNNPRPVVSGTAEPFSTVTVLLDGSAIGTAPVNAAGGWSFTPTANWANGPRQLSARAVDRAGNAGPASAARAVTVDTNAPAAPAIDSPADGALLNVNRPAVQGSAEPGARVEVWVDGALADTVEADGSTGAWSFTPVAALGEGAHGVRARARDAAGNVGPFGATTAVTVDTTAPEAPSILAPADGGSLGNPRPTVSGVAEPNARVDFFLDGLPAGSATADGAGVWSLTPADAWADGPHALTARATDAAENVGSLSPAVNVTVDTGAPAAPALSGPVNGSAGFSDPPAVTGSSEANATVEVFIDGVSVGTASTAADGSFTFAPPAPLGDGPHTFAARATDAAGNVGPLSADVTATVDTAPPAAPVITAPGEGALFNDRVVTLSGTAEPLSRVSVVVDGVEAGSVLADASGAWSLPSARLSDGPHQVRARAFDGVGNEGPESAAVAFRVDGGPPNTSLTAAPPVLARLRDAAFSFAADEDAVTFECRLDRAGAFAPCAVPYAATGLADGEHRLEVRAVDASGNADPTPAVHVWTVDTVAPAAPTVGAVRDGTGAVRFEGSAEPNATVVVVLDGVEVGTAVADGEGRWTLPPVPVQPGDHQVFARATDAAGNAGPDSSPFEFGRDGLPLSPGGSFFYSGGGWGCSSAGGSAGGWLPLAAGLGWALRLSARRPGRGRRGAGWRSRRTAAR